jgi:hypothetical protein
MVPITVVHTVPRTHRSRAITWQPTHDGPLENISQWDDNKIFQHTAQLEEELRDHRMFVFGYAIIDIMAAMGARETIASFNAQHAQNPLRPATAFWAIVRRNGELLLMMQIQPGGSKLFSYAVTPSDAVLSFSEMGNPGVGNDTDAGMVVLSLGSTAQAIGVLQAQARAHAAFKRAALRNKSLGPLSNSLMQAVDQENRLQALASEAGKI